MTMRPYRAKQRQRCLLCATSSVRGTLKVPLHGRRACCCAQTRAAEAETARLRGALACAQEELDAVVSQRCVRQKDLRVRWSSCSFAPVRYTCIDITLVPLQDHMM